VRVGARVLTHDVGLSRAELATSAVAVVASVGAYLTQGSPYLARGVVGDLLGFAVLAMVGRRAGRRLRHEAFVCLAGIGLVLIAGPGWPLAIPDAVWWIAFVVGLAGFLAVRRTFTGRADAAH